MFEAGAPKLNEGAAAGVALLGFASEGPPKEKPDGLAAGAAVGLESADEATAGAPNEKAGLVEAGVGDATPKTLVEGVLNPV